MTYFDRRFTSARLSLVLSLRQCCQRGLSYHLGWRTAITIMLVLVSGRPTEAIELVQRSAFLDTERTPVRTEYSRATFPLAQADVAQIDEQRYRAALREAQVYRIWLYVLSSVLIFAVILLILRRLQALSGVMQQDEAKFRNIFENSQIGIFRTRLEDGLVLDANQRFIHMLGFDTAQEVIGQVCTRDLYVDTAARQRAIEILRTEGEVQNFEVECYRRDGTTFWGLYSARFNPEAGYSEGVIADITDRKLAEAALRKSEGTNRAIINAIPDLMMRLTRNGTYLDFIPAKNFRTFYRETRLDLVGKNIFETLPYDLAQKRMQHIEEALQTGELQIYEYGFPFEDRIQYEEARIFVSGHNEVIVIVRDITDRKQTEEALRQSEAINRAMNEALPDLLIRMKRDGTFITVKEPTSDLPLIKPVEEMIGRNVRDILPPAAAEQRLAATERALQTGKTQVYELLLEIQQQPRWQETRLVPLSEDEVLVVVRDITIRKQAESNLRAQQMFLRQVIDAVPSAIFVKDPQGRFLTVNRAEATRHNATVEEMLGKYDSEFNSNQEQVAEFHRTNLEVMETLQPQVFPNQAIVNPQGELHWYQTIISPFIDAGGKVKGIIGSVVDITSLKQVEEELRHAKEAAEAANRAKSQFLSNMSHELRTPLNIILGFTQLMMRGGDLNPQQQNYLDTISRSGEHLLILINDVLEMSKIEAGRITLNEADIDLQDLLNSLQQMLHLKAESKGLQLVFERAIDLPRYIHTDEGKLRQVLMNLLGNAIKFTQTGCVTLRVNWQNWESEVGEGKAIAPYALYFEVEDTGPGIAPAELEHLFEPFVQTETGTNSNEGTGLGLAISSKFVQLMGGTITVESEVNKGTIFRFDIYVQIAEAEVIQSSSQPYQQVIGLETGQPTYRILIAEDKLANRQLLLELLVPIGFEVREAVNGQEAIDLWQSWQPHLIWMDIRMPVMDGYEATRQIKESGQPTPVIVALTGSAFEEDRVRALSIGCDDFVRKPVRAEVIFEKMAEHLGVLYLYKIDDHQSIHASDSKIDNFTLTAESLTQLPSDCIEQLHQAAIRVNSKQIRGVIEQIKAIHPQIAEALTRLVDDFNFEEIVELTQSVGDKR